MSSHRLVVYVLVIIHGITKTMAQNVSYSTKEYVFNTMYGLSPIPSKPRNGTNPNTKFDQDFIGHINVYDIIELNFDIIFHESINGPYHFSNILEIGRKDWKFYPMIGLVNNSTKLFVEFTTTESQNDGVKFDYGLNKHQLHHIQVIITQNRIYIKINDIVWLDDIFASHYYLTYLPIYPCTNYDICANSTISSINITSFNIDNNGSISDRDSFYENKSFSKIHNPSLHPTYGIQTFEIKEISNITRGNIIGYIDINNVMMFEYDIIIHSKRQHWSNVFTIGTLESEKYGTVELVGRSSQLKMSFSNLHDNNNGIYIPNSAELELGYKHHIYFKVTQNSVIAKLNDSVVYKGSYKSHDNLKHLPIHTCGTAYQCSDVILFDLRILSSPYDSINESCTEINNTKEPNLRILVEFNNNTYDSNFNDKPAGNSSVWFHSIMVYGICIVILVIVIFLCIFYYDFEQNTKYFREKLRLILVMENDEETIQTDSDDV